MLWHTPFRPFLVPSLSLTSPQTFCDSSFYFWPTISPSYSPSPMLSGSLGDSMSSLRYEVPLFHSDGPIVSASSLPIPLGVRVVCSSQNCALKLLKSL